MREGRRSCWICLIIDTEAFVISAVTVTEVEEQAVVIIVVVHDGRWFEEEERNLGGVYGSLICPRRFLRIRGASIARE